MKQSFSSQITIRLYDTSFAKDLDDKYKASGERYESKNHFLTEMLKEGYREKYKVTLLAQQTSLDKTECNDKAVENTLNQIKELIVDFFVSNKQQSLEILAHLQISEKLISAVYNMLLALLEDERISSAQLAEGFYDDLPERIANDLKEMLKRILQRLPK